MINNSIKKSLNSTMPVISYTDPFVLSNNHTTLLSNNEVHAISQLLSQKAKVFLVPLYSIPLIKPGLEEVSDKVYLRDYNTTQSEEGIEKFRNTTDYFNNMMRKQLEHHFNSSLSILNETNSFNDSKLYFLPNYNQTSLFNILSGPVGYIYNTTYSNQLKIFFDTY